MGAGVDFVAEVLADGDQHLKDQRAPWGERPRPGALFRDQFLITSDGITLR